MKLNCTFLLLSIVSLCYAQGTDCSVSGQLRLNTTQNGSYLFQLSITNTGSCVITAILVPMANNGFFGVATSTANISAIFATGDRINIGPGGDAPSFGIIGFGSLAPGQIFSNIQLPLALYEAGIQLPRAFYETILNHQLDFYPEAICNSICQTLPTTGCSARVNAQLAYTIQGTTMEDPVQAIYNVYFANQGSCPIVNATIQFDDNGQLEVAIGIIPINNAGTFLVPNTPIGTGNAAINIGWANLNLGDTPVTVPISIINLECSSDCSQGPSPTPSSTPSSAPATPIPSSAPVSPSDLTIKVTLSSGSSSWWFSITVSDDAGATVGIQFMDSGSYSSWTALSATNYGTWIFSPSAALVLPLSLRLHNSASVYVIATNIITSFSTTTALDTLQTYGGSSSSPTTPSPSSPTSAPSSPSRSPTTAPSAPGSSPCELSAQAIQSSSWTSDGVMSEVLGLNIVNNGQKGVSDIVITINTDGVVSEMWGLTHTTGSSYRVALYNTVVAPGGSVSGSGFQLTGASSLSIAVADATCY